MALNRKECYHKYQNGRWQKRMILKLSEWPLTENIIFVNIQTDIERKEWCLKTNIEIAIDRKECFYTYEMIMDRKDCVYKYSNNPWQ